MTKIEDLKKQIETCEKQKKDLVNYEMQLALLEAKAEISRVEHNLYLHNFSNGKSLQEWHDYYNTHIKDCKNKIRHEQLTSLGTKELTAFLLISMFLVVLLFGPPSVTGFFVYEEAGNKINLFFVFIVKILAVTLLYMKARQLMIDII